LDFGFCSWQHLLPLTCTYAHPWVAAYYRSRISGKNDELVSLQIEELKDNQYIVAGVACTKNAWGKTIIYKINDILRKELPQNYWRAFVERWLDQNAISDYRNAYEKILLYPLQKGQ
jgi:hypothetical protein